MCFVDVEQTDNSDILLVTCKSSGRAIHLVTNGNGWHQQHGFRSHVSCQKQYCKIYQYITNTCTVKPKRLKHSILCITLLFEQKFTIV
ncbi:hypothetical protein MTR_3g022935 [Medicago truncatula]|uniref:Uncharacterized protein n=1 Tax=Medicago truncatula TaxID=3880 RepID=A0A072UTY4_MEDTR|nr:hypothetical protein MTR_3g022935 [Medicago truncatula]